MVEKFYRFFALVLVALLSFASLAEDTAPVLYWMVEDPDVTELDGEPYFVSEILSRPDGLKVNGAQVRVLGEDLTEAVYLKLYENVDGAWTLSDNSIAPVVYIPDTESNPPLPDMAYAGPKWASFGDYVTGSYQFQIELGNYDEGGKWTIIAVSDIETMETLEKFTSTDITAVPGYYPWTPTFTVPEPSSGLLLLIGGALLSLRRRSQRS